MHKKRASSKIKSFFTRFVLATTVFLLSTVSVLSIFSTANAANPQFVPDSVAYTMSPEDQARSYAYYKYLRQCFSYGYYAHRIPVINQNNWISAESGRNYDWFAQPFNTGGGSLQTAKVGEINNVTGAVINITGDSTQDCFQDTFRTIMAQAAPLWGYSGTDGSQMLCDIGFKPESGINASRCAASGETGWRYETPSSVTSKLDTWYKDVIGFKSTDFSAIEPSGGAYAMYLRTFQIFCAVELDGISGVAYPDVRVLESPETASTAVDYDTKDASHKADTTANLYEGGGKKCQELYDELKKKEDVSGAFIKGMLAWINLNRDAPDEGANDCTNPTYAAAHPDQCDPNDDGTQTCNIPSVGFLLCPLLVAGAGLADSAYGFLANDFLETDVSLLNTNPSATGPDGELIGTGTFTAWGIVRNIANVAFVIAILIVIFSQLSNYGVSNYGVKKLLPRIIVSAILVNLSFIVCQLAVDISNILGYSLKGAMEAVAVQINADIPSVADAAALDDQSGHLGGIVLTVAVTGALVWINIGAIIVAIVGALVALLTIFVLLVARKVLIVLLIVLAPLAFVAYLLPNTESLFQKWRKAFTALLMLFPIIGLLYGGGILANAVLLQVAGDDMVMKIAAYMALVIPLIATIPILRGSLSAIGNVGSAIQNAGNKFKGLAEGKAQKTYDNSRLGQFRKYRTDRWNQGRAKLQSGGRFAGGKKNPLNWLSAGNRGLNRISGRFGDKLSAQGDYLANKEDAELMDASNAKVSNMKNANGIPLSTDEMFKLLNGEDVGNIRAKQLGNHDRRALASTIAGRADAIELNKLVDIAAKEKDAIVRNSMTDSIYSAPAKSKMSWLGSTTRADLINGPTGKFGSSRVRPSTLSMQEGATKGKMTAEALALGDDKSVNEMVSAVEAMSYDDPGRAKAVELLAQAYQDFNSDEFDSKLKANVVKGGEHDKAIQRIAGLIGGVGGDRPSGGGGSDTLF